MPKTSLLAGEFAINEGAALTIAKTVVKFNPTKKNAVTLTLTFDLASTADLQATAGAILFNSCGVFKAASTGTGVIQDLSLFITSATPPATPEIQLISPSGDLEIITDGEKGNNGNAFLSTGKNRKPAPKGKKKGKALPQRKIKK